jgi:hypothetical protein
MVLSKRKLQRRRGGITLEFILALPVLLIAMFAVFQFALFSVGSQQVALASRVGAEAASQIPLPNRRQYGIPPMLPCDKVPAYVVDAVLQQLRSAGIEPCCIILEHNANTFPSPPHADHYISPHQVFVTEFSGGLSQRPDTPLPPESVRLTVCVGLSQLMPNCLSTFGFDIRDKTAQHTTVFRHEL